MGHFLKLRASAVDTLSLRGVNVSRYLPHLLLGLLLAAIAVAVGYLIAVSW